MKTGELSNICFIHSAHITMKRCIHVTLRSHEEKEDAQWKVAVTWNAQKKENGPYVLCLVRLKVYDWVHEEVYNM